VDVKTLVFTAEPGVPIAIALGEEVIVWNPVEMMQDAGVV
jgi:hypothetical protein